MGLLSARTTKIINFPGTFSFQREIFHFVHCAALIGTIILVFYVTGGHKRYNLTEVETAQSQNWWEKYGLIPASFLYIIRILPLLCLPVALFNFLGLVLFNAFPDQPKLKACTRYSPFFCFRVVTKGDFPELVRSNILRNVKTCQDAGLQNFVLEVVTDKSIHLVASQHVREIVVPEDYITRSGALYKARALQYCLETEVNVLSDEDWIVHLDEETLLTVGCVKGIFNFVCEGKYQFGQGVITYSSGQVVNLILTLFDSMRVADDMGKVQFQLKVMCMPIMGWKGSYVISNVGAERNVSFDHGLRSSVAEDAYFGLVAASKGYLFGFIEGDMREKSPFTINDFLKQRKRWIQGLLLVVHSSEIPLRFRILLGCCVYATATAPLTTLNIILQPCFPIQISQFVDLCGCFIAGVLVYMSIYGTIRSYKITKIGMCKLIFVTLLGLILKPIAIVLEVIAILWGIFTPTTGFAVVDKNNPQPFGIQENVTSIL